MPNPIQVNAMAVGSVTPYTPRNNILAVSRIPIPLMVTGNIVTNTDKGIIKKKLKNPTVIPTDLAIKKYELPHSPAIKWSIRLLSVMHDFDLEKLSLPE